MNKNIKMKRIFLLIGLLVSLFIMTSCDKNKENLDDTLDKVKDTFKSSTAYGIVYYDYVGFITVTKADDLVVHIDIDEAFMPIVWAQETKTDVLSDVVTYENGTELKTSNNYRYAKYLKIGDKIFTGVAYTDDELQNATSTKQLIKYSSEGINDLHQYLKEEEHAKWYVEQLKMGKAFVCDKDGKKIETTDLNPQGSFFKSSSLYWTTGDTGWAKNIQYFSNALVGTNLSGEITKEDGFVKIGDVVTSATLSGYKDYYDLAKKAYEAID